jgi:shikimate dehydrogenase
LSKASEILDSGVSRFLYSEISVLGIEIAGLPPLDSQRPVTSGLRPADIAAIGTTADKAVKGELLAQALLDRGFERRLASSWKTPEELVGDPHWQLGVVLSPWKRTIGEHCDLLAESAAACGVVDTLLRTEAGLVGFNTNTWAAQSALEVLTGNVPPETALLLGSGASVRSVVLAMRRKWPGCEVFVAARSSASSQDLSATFGLRILGEVEDTKSGWDLVVNTTTWGETEISEEEPFAISVEGIFHPGGRFFDLNNRISSLQHQALSSGCAVVSGGVMQRVTNACRAALLACVVGVN